MQLEVKQKRERAGNGNALPPEKERTKPMSFGERMQLEMKLQQSEHEDTLTSPERSAKPLSFGARMQLEMQQRQRPGGKGGNPAGKGGKGGTAAVPILEEGSATEEGETEPPVRKEPARVTVFDLDFGPLDDGFADADEADAEAEPAPLPDTAFLPVARPPTPPGAVVSVKLDPGAAEEALAEIDGLFDFLA